MYDVVVRYNVPLRMCVSAFNCIPSKEGTGETLNKESDTNCRNNVSLL